MAEALTHPISPKASPRAEHADQPTAGAGLPAPPLLRWVARNTPTSGLRSAGDRPGPARLPGTAGVASPRGSGGGSAAAAHGGGGGGEKGNRGPTGTSGATHSCGGSGRPRPRTAQRPSGGAALTCGHARRTARSPPHL